MAWISENLFDHLTYTTRHGLLRGIKRKGGLGWIPAWISGEIETPEHRFWKSLDLKGLVIYDVGAFQGLLTLFFAQQARTVVCYEPNSGNHKRLTENIRLNHFENVQVRKLGVGAAPREAVMVFSPLMPGGASLDDSIAHKIRKSDSSAVSEQIRITTLDQDIADASLPPPDLIKIDIEGWELEALHGACHTVRQYFPALFLEMHGETLNEKRNKAAAITAYLDELGYREIYHVESGTKITAANSQQGAQGHLFCPGSTGTRRMP